MKDTLENTLACQSGAKRGYRLQSHDTGCLRKHQDVRHQYSPMELFGINLLKLIIVLHLTCKKFSEGPLFTIHREAPGKNN